MRSLKSVSIRGMLQSQFIQMTRQRGILFGMVGATLLLMAIGALAAQGIASSVVSGTFEISPQQIREIPSFGFVFAQLLLGSASILLVTTEWSSGAIITSIATTQRKSGILLSKATVAIAFSALSVLIGGLLTLIVSNVLLQSAARSIDIQDGLVRRELIGLVSAGVFTSIIAVGLAFLIRKTAMALIAYIALTIVTPIAFGMFPTDFMQRVSAHLPLNASGYMMTTGDVPELGLPVTYAYITMAAWALVSLAAGWWRMVRTD